MFEHLKRHSVIIVTGPQRSGTRLGAQVIANDTGHTYIDEAEVGVCNPDMLTTASREHNVVIHCPAMLQEACEIHTALVVCMYRDISDIIKSEKKINWNSDFEKKKYKPESEIPVSQQKYEYWHKHKPENHMEIVYDRLSSHTMWIDPKYRKLFQYWQTTQRPTQ